MEQQFGETREPVARRPATAALRLPSALQSLSVRFYLLLAALGVLALAPWLVGEQAHRTTDGFALELEQAGSLRYRLLEMRIELPRARDDAAARDRIEAMIQQQKKVFHDLLAGNHESNLPPCPTADLCARLTAHQRHFDDVIEPHIRAALGGDSNASRQLGSAVSAEVQALDLTVRIAAREVQDRIERNTRIGIGISAGSVVLVVLVGLGVWNVFARIRRLKALAEGANASELRGKAEPTDEIAALAEALANGIDAEKERRRSEQRRARALMRQQLATRNAAQSFSSWIAGESDLDIALSEVAKAAGYERARLLRGEDAHAEPRPNARQIALAWGERALGTLELAGEQDAEPDEVLLETLSQVFSIVVLADRLMAEKEEQGHLAIALGSVAARPTESEFGAILRRLIAHDCALIELVEATGRIEDVWAIHPDRLERLRTLCDDPVASRVTAISAEDGEGCHALHQRCPGAKLLIPLAVNGTVVGSLNLSRKEGEFSLQDKRSAETLAPVVASALARIQLEARLRFAEQWSTLGAFGRLLAHEIKNPLNSLSLELQLLERRVAKIELPDADRERVGSSIGVVKNELARLLSLTNDYLSLNKNGVDRQTAPVDLRGIVREVLRTYQATMADLHVELKSELGDEPAMVLGDPDRLKQLVHNLLGNAVEALSAAPVRVATLRIRKRGTDVELSLRDTGPGIVDPISIFSPGFTTKASGTGMGLAISQQIARQHGGRLVARALDAGGSEFTLTLSQMDIERDSRPPPSVH